VNIRSIEDIWEVTPAQHGMFMQDGARTGLYIEQLRFRLNGALDTRILRSAWERTLRNHSILRASFHANGLDRPLQVIRRKARLSWSEFDLRDCAPQLQAQWVESIADGMRKRGFDLADAPLLRLIMAREADTSFILLLTYHHIILDGWSAAMLLEQMFADYAQRRTGKPTVNATGPRFGDYIRYLAGCGAVDATRFWQSAPRRNLFSTERISDAIERRDPYGECERIIPKGAADAMAAVARDQHLSFHTLLQAALSLALRQTGDEDFTLGSTFSGRAPEWRGAERLIGPCAVTLPIRVSFDGDHTVAEWLAQIQKQNKLVQQWQCGQPSITRDAAPRDSRAPFETALVFENYPKGLLDGMSACDLRIDHIHFSGGRTQYPLVIIAVPEEGVRLRAVFDISRVSASTAEEILASLYEIAVLISERHQTPLAKLLEITADRVRLPHVGHMCEQRHEADLTPQTETERKVQAVWAELLDAPTVGIHDDFFKLGGHSLLLTRVIANLRAAFQIELPLSEILAGDLTVSGIAATINRLQARSESDLESLISSSAA
jgi:hypothetical protein